MDITESEGYKKLLAAVEKDEQNDPKEHGRYFHDYRATLAWAVARAEQYAQATGLDAGDILTAWEKERRYWYMNFYQECNQPAMNGSRVRVFDTVDALNDAVGDSGFRCPCCKGVSHSAYACDSGLEMEPGKVCDWKVYGLFTDLGLGIYVFVKEAMRGQKVFMPIAWEARD